MIRLMRLNGEELTVNAYQIETVERGADTCVSLMNGKRLFVQESVEDVEALMMNWFRKIHGAPQAEVPLGRQLVSEEIPEQASQSATIFSAKLDLADVIQDQSVMVDEEAL